MSLPRNQVMPRPRSGGHRARSGGHRSAGFTLLEVLIAVAILSLSLTSLLSSQMASLRATRYAQGVTAAAFLAEYQLVEIEWQVQKDGGWVDSDQTYEGDFSEQGWPDVRYECVVDFIELPDYSQIARAVDAAENATGGSSDNVQDAGEQAFGVLGMVWPIVKAAIEQSIRKAHCTVYWRDGKVEHDVAASTFWTDVSKLDQLPQLGGEFGDADDKSGDEAGEPGGGPGGRPGIGPGGGGPGGRGPGIAPGGIGPMGPGGGRPSGGAP